MRSWKCQTTRVSLAGIEIANASPAAVLNSTMYVARSVTNDFESYVKLNKRVPPEVVGVVRRIEDYAELADTHKEKKRSTTRFAPPSSARLRFQRHIVPPPLCRT